MHDGRGEAQKCEMGRSGISGKEREQLTVPPFLMRAMVLAVSSFPRMNALRR